MAEITLGKYDDGTPCKISVERLIETRALVQASSGGGKSYLMRKLIEELHGKVQILVLDIEGEFGTLREKYDFILAGKGGDVAADPRYAFELALKALEMRADMILDLYELKQYDRIRFVKVFLDAMVNAPKDLWHPVVVILDEAHIFAPEKSKAESLTAVSDMISRGRKRGFCLIPATQRPAKLDKDVVAECQNKIIGLGNTDIDRERGAKELGFTERAKILSMRDLEPGQFYAVGPALSKRGANLMKVGAVQTRHPKSGSGRIQVHTPAPTAKVKEQLAKLANLPREAEEERRGVAEWKARAQQLERELRIASTVKLGPVNEIENAYRSGLQKGQAGAAKQIAQFMGQFNAWLNQAPRGLASEGPSAPPVPALKPAFTVSIPSKPEELFKKPFRVQPSGPEPIAALGMGACERKILAFLAVRRGDWFTPVQVGAMTGYSHGSGGFNNALSKLNSAGLIERGTGRIRLRDGVDVEGLAGEEPHTLRDWISKLGLCERKIYERLLQEPEMEWAAPALGDATGYSAGSGGFNNALSRLSTLGLIERPGKGIVRLNPEIARLGGVL